MRIAVLSRKATLYSTRRLQEAAIARGHRCTVLDTLAFSIALEAANPDLYYKGKVAPVVDAVIPRIGASITYYGTALVRQFDQMGVVTLNSALAIANSRDKLRSLQILSRHDIGIPATAFVRRREDVLPTIKRLGGAPVVLKLLEGTQGVGVILAENLKVAEAIIATLQSAKQNVLIQRFVSESKGRDVRAFVVGDRVVAAMRRIARGAEFRSNVHLGGRTEPVKLDEAFERAAVRAAQILGLRVAGVDMLEGRDGPQIMEVNSSPGLEGIEAATGVDVAGAVIESLEDQVQFPELDIRQRLALSEGYLVCELPVRENSPFAGHTVSESGLRQRDIVVLSIQRGSTVIANPKGTRQMLPGDRLLCFGKREGLAPLVPRSRPRKPSRPRARKR